MLLLPGNNNSFDIQCNPQTPQGRLTPRITRPPATLRVYDKQRVAGRVHALVMLASERQGEASRAITLPLSGGITPRITRRPEPLLEHDKIRVGGRVHAPVRLRLALAHPAPPAS